MRSVGITPFGHRRKTHRDTPSFTNQTPAPLNPPDAEMGVPPNSRTIGNFAAIRFTDARIDGEMESCIAGTRAKEMNEALRDCSDSLGEV